VRPLHAPSRAGRTPLARTSASPVLQRDPSTISPAHNRAAPGGEGTLRLIIAYKLGRAALSFLGGVTLLGLAVTGAAGPLHVAAARLHEHAASGIALSISSALLSAVDPKHVVVVAGALLLDAATLFVEGWALHRRLRWAVWVVVIAAAAMLPFEVVALATRASAVRALLLLGNILVVAWLVRRRLSEPPEHLGA
jgi:uncharacterized membrane protein (DUF2068 family)